MEQIDTADHVNGTPAAAASTSAATKRTMQQEAKAPARPGPSASRRPDAADRAKSHFDVSPLRLAERILQRPEWASRCLLVRGDRGQFLGLYTQDPTTGIWRDPEETVLGWLGTISDELEREAYGLGRSKLMDPKVVYNLVRGARGIKTPDRVKTVCRSFAAGDKRLQDQGLEAPLWRCRPIELNSNLRFLGVQNGVVDLHTATLVGLEEAAPALITISTPVPYDPDRFPPADWFLSHLIERERNWWLDIFGFALRGIAKRLYACLAAPDSGKTTAINLLRGTLGPYVDSPTPGALDARQRYDASGHTPGLAAWAAPVRITIIDELKERELNANVVKDLTGGGVITYRDTYEKRASSRATGTTFIFANDSAGEAALPQLRTDDPGMRARYRELPFPRIPDDQRDPAMRDEWPHDPERQAQLLTLLVSRAAANPTEPTDIPSVAEKTAARLRKDSGRLGAFATRFVRDGAAVLEFPALWEEWCRACGEPISAPAPGGIGKRDIYRRLSVYVDGLEKPVPLTIKGKKVRGLRGWRLLSVEEAELRAGSPTAYGAIQKAIQNLRDAISNLSTQECDDIRRALLEPARLSAMERVYSRDESTLNQAMAANRSHQHMKENVERFRGQGMDEQRIKALIDLFVIEELQQAAEYIEDVNRPVSPAFARVIEHYNNLGLVRVWRECVAFTYLNKTDRRLGVEADETALLEGAVELLAADLNKEPANNKGKEPPDKATFFDDADIEDLEDIEVAMRELLGLQAAREDSVEREGPGPAAPIN